MDPINALLTTTAVITVATLTAIVLIERSKSNLAREQDARLAALEERRKKQLQAELDRVARNSEVNRRIVEAAPVKLTPVGNVARPALPLDLSEATGIPNSPTYAAVPKKRTPVLTGHAYTPSAPRVSEPDIITPIVVTSLLMSDAGSRAPDCAPSSSYDSGSSSSYDSGSSSSCGGGE